MSREELISFKPYLKSKSAYKGGIASGPPGFSGTIHKMSSNENAWGPSPMVKEGLPWILDNLHRYPDAEDARLRNALATFHGGTLDPEQFLTGNSGSETLEMIFRAFLEPGDECIFSSPGFIPYWEFPQKFGALAIDVPLIEDAHTLDVTALLAAINERTKLVLLGSPNNPTGNIISSDLLLQYFQNVPDHVVTILDEVYCHYVEDSTYVNAEQLLQDGHRVIGVNTFSKAFGLAGLRIGYAYGPLKLITYIRLVRRPFMINRVSYEAALLALQDSQHLDQVREWTSTEKIWLYLHMSDLNIKYWKSQANFILIKLNNAAEVVDYLFQSGILVRPVDAFGAPGHIRITVGRREANRALIEALQTWMKK